MSILVFVMSLIMLLSVMTWSRLETFLQSRLQAEEWVWLMKESERSVFNRIEKAHVPAKTAAQKTPKAPKDKKTDSKPAPTPGSGQISLAWLFDKSFRENAKERSPKMQEVIEKLIDNLWKDQPFYKKLESERPRFVRALLAEIIELTGDKIKKFEDLIDLNWRDYELKEALGRMIQSGLVYKRPPLKPGEKPEVPAHSPVGFQSLKDYFTSKKLDKIRVWLAPRALLLALFNDPQTVAEIVRKREELYKEVKNSRSLSGEAQTAYTKQFEGAFSSRTPYGDLLDFTVTTTDPRKR